MTLKVCLVDTNVIVSGLIGADPNSPPARILDAMLAGDLLYLMSEDLLDEYASVLRRPSLVRLHGRTDDELDVILSELVANAIWREPVAGSDAPDTGDNHLWALLASHPHARHRGPTPCRESAQRRPCDLPTAFCRYVFVAEKILTTFTTAAA